MSEIHFAEADVMSPNSIAQHAATKYTAWNDARPPK